MGEKEREREIDRQPPVLVLTGGRTLQLLGAQRALQPTE